MTSCRWTHALLLLAFASRCHNLVVPVYAFSITVRGRGRRGASSQLGLSPPSSATTAQAAPVNPAAARVLDFYASLDSLYDRSSAIRCPFFRRRAADLIDGAAEVARFLIVRHKSLPGISDLFLDGGDSAATALVADALSAPGCRPRGRHVLRHPDGTAREKARLLPVADVAERIRLDWTGGSGGEGKGYYITGRLDSTVYRDDCLFTGPDPDMPVRGLRKYLSAAASLFDQKQSDARMLSFLVNDDGGGRNCGMVKVRWRLGGVIKLPWHPTVEPWTGTTVYHLDEEGLVYLHEETWDISVWRAFTCTLYPEAKLWGIWDTERTCNL